VAQHDDDRHLTTEQLSALLDQQLPSQEQAKYNAHLKTCRQCQNVMADLKLTVALLHGLPQPTLPRSFVLPATTAHAQEQPGHNIRPLTTTTRRTPPNRLGHLARRSIRTISTIAAVIGLIFILSSFLTTHSFGVAGTSSSTGSIPVSGPGRGSAITTPHVKLSPNCVQSGTPPVQCSTQHTPAAAQGQTPGVTVPVTPTPQIKNQPKQNSTSSPAIDLNSPQVHLGLGAILLLIGVLGVALTRKRRE
jgi:anti-sigma factor RsiW